MVETSERGTEIKMRTSESANRDMRTSESANMERTTSERATKIKRRIETTHVSARLSSSPVSKCTSSTPRLNASLMMGATSSSVVM
jgi:hypothetical protein